MKKNLAMHVLAILMIWIIILVPIQIAEALSISNVRVGNVTHNTALIFWDTDEDSTGTVVYGTEKPPSNTQLDTNLADEHGILIAGLTSSAQHYYQIIAQKDTEEVVNNNSGNFYTFFTETAPDTTPPRALENLNYSTYTKDTIVLDWEKNGLDSDVRDYNIYRDDILIATKGSSSFTDLGLTPLTTYTYKISGVDTAGNEGPNSSIEITTRSETWKEIIVHSDTVNALVLGTSVLITWQTNDATGTSVHYGLSPEALDTVDAVTQNSTSHNISLTGLQTYSNYSFKVVSCDKFNNCGESSVRAFKTEELIELYLQIDIPRFYNTHRLDLRGRASKGALVYTYLNGNRHRFTTVGESQEFYMLAQLDPNKDASDPNYIRIEATDASGLLETTENVPVVVDSTPPDVEITVFPGFTSDSSITIKGNITDDNYPIEAKFYIYSTSDITAPPMVMGLTNTSTQKNSISMIWDEVNDTGLGLQSYIIYRTDIGAIAETSQTNYMDSAVLTNTEYFYQIAAMDQAGLIGEKSDELSITTLPGGTVDTDLPEEIVPSNPSLKKTVQLNEGEFSESLGTLNEESRNDIVLEFYDQAGNKYEESKIVVYDAYPPQFIEPTNIDKYTPSYIRDLTINGQVDDNATIYAFVVNADLEGSFDPIRAIGELIGTMQTTEAPENLQSLPGLESATVFSTVALPDGTFSLPIVLSGSPFVTFGQADGSSQQTRGSGRNKVVLYAVDRAGQASNPLEGYIDYNSCDEGTWWGFKEPPSITPTYFNPRELTRGYGSLSLTYELEWNGGTAEPGRIDRVEFSPVFLSPGDEEKYDNNWLAGHSAPSQSADKTLGYISWNIQPPEQEGDTSNERELAIGKNRQGECFNELGSGCMKAFIKMDISFSQPQLSTTAADGGQSFTGKQVICLPIDVMIGQRINTSNIPVDLLNFSIHFIDAMINVTDALLGPLTQIYQYTYWTCLVGFLGEWVQSVRVEWNCRYSSAVQSGGLGGLIKSAAGFDRFYGVASQGEDMCRTYAAMTAGKDDDGTNYQQIFDACKECGDQIDNLRWYQNKYHYICDRVVCPSVPSLQYHIKSSYPGSKARDGGITNEGGSLNDIDKFRSQVTDSIVNKGANAKSDCEYVEKRNRETITKMAENYENGLNSEECGEPHVFQAACCVYEYKNIWDPATLLLDPLERSVCFADSSKCGVGHAIWEGVTGICQPGDGGEELDVDKNLQFNEAVIGTGGAKEVYIYAKIGEDGNLDDVQLGKIVDVKRLTAEGPVAIGRNNENKKVVQGLEFTPLITGLSEYFDKIGDPEAEEKAELGAKSKFVTTVNTQLGSKLRDGYTQDDIGMTYERIANLVGTTEHQYVVQPHAGFLETIATVCLNSFISYLQKWKVILTQFKRCFEAILITGDGTPGMCEALIATEICDLLHSAIDCGVNRFRLESQRMSFGGVGNIAGALAGAGERASNSAVDRYGSDNVFTNQFSLGNLVHGACMFWFFGEWPSDWQNLLNPNPEVPISSNAIIPVANRRFHGFNPIDGTTDYVYQIAFNLYAGSSIDYRMDLLCSGTEKACPENPGSRCDCGHGGGLAEAEKIRSVGLTSAQCNNDCGTPLQQNQVCDTECFIQVNSKVRFDKARLCWTYYKEPGAAGVQDVEALEDCQDADISEIGRAPSFCSFDLATLGFSCGLEIGGTGFAAFRKFDTTHEPPIYQTGDSAVIQMNIEQRTPEELRLGSAQDTNGTRYIEIIIVNDQGKQVYPALGQPVKMHRLNGHQTHELTFYDSFDFADIDSFTITPDMFGTAAATASCWKTSPTNGFEIAQVICPPERLTGSGNRAAKIVDLGDRAGEHQLSYTEGTYLNGIFTTTSGSTDFTDSSFAPCQSQPDAFAGQYKATCGPFDVYVTSNFYENQPTQNYASSGEKWKTAPSVITYYNPPSSITNTGDCDSKLHPWTLTATLHDAIPDGFGWKPAPYPAKDDLQNDQIQTKIIQVRCQELAGSGSLTSLVGSMILNSDVSSQGGVSASNLVYGETVTIRDFSAIAGIVTNEGVKGQGFKVTIDVSTLDPNKVIPITFDLAQLQGVMPADIRTISVKKDGSTTLFPCDSGGFMCYTGSGIQFTLHLRDGDPVFTITGLETEAIRTARTLKGLGTGSVQFNAGDPSDYGIDIVGLNSGENVVVSNYREGGQAGDQGFLLDIEINAQYVEVDVDIEKLGWVVGPNTEIYRGAHILPYKTPPQLNEYCDGMGCWLEWNGKLITVKGGALGDKDYLFGLLVQATSTVASGANQRAPEGTSSPTTSSTPAGGGPSGAVPSTQEADSGEQQAEFTEQDCTNLQYFAQEGCGAYDSYIIASPHLYNLRQIACNDDICNLMTPDRCRFDDATQLCIPYDY